MNDAHAPRPKPRVFALERETTPMRVAAALRAEIASGALAPGTHIPELDFTAAFGVSRHTLREAISLLVAEGLLTRTSFKGVQVTKLSSTEVRDIFAARRVIELAAVDAVPSAPAHLREALMTTITDLVALPPTVTGPEMSDADVAVHRAIVAIHGSDRLCAIHRALMAEIRLLLVRVYVPEDVADTRTTHAIFARHLQMGDIAGARAELDRHLRRSEDVVVRGAQRQEAGG
ncbi:GntR family transcriptional regulator [Acidisoma sp. 7E03]